MSTRITGGAWRGRLLVTPAGQETRPTRAVVREALFNIVGPRIADAWVVDLFAGSGAVGFEALSRGARRVDFVEEAQPAARAIAETAEKLGCAAQIGIHRRDVIAWLQQNPIPESGLVFLDAPYRDEAVVAALELLGARPPRLLVCEHHRSRRLEAEYGGLIWRRSRRYGISSLSFYEPG